VDFCEKKFNATHTMDFCGKKNAKNATFLGLKLFWGKNLHIWTIGSII